jgi:hypothetical protein
MSVAEAAHRPANSGRTMRLWLGFLIIIAAAIGLAWLGAGSLRPQVSSTGLEFRTVKAGKGDLITANDVALLEYVLTSDDGSVLDASEKPMPFIEEGVYPGFAEAMGRMQEGGEYRFTMPQSLAFVNSPPPPNFPKDTKLTFEVRVRQIARGSAQMYKQMQAAQQGGVPAQQ